MKYLIKNVAIIKTDTGEILKQDILIENGIISEIEPDIKVGKEYNLIDATGMYATAGWIDAHAHLYFGDGLLGVNKEEMFADGVTCAVDAGTAGPGNFTDFYENILSVGNVKGKAFLNLAYMGVISNNSDELKHLEQVNLLACEEICKKYKDTILGLKVRIDPRVCENAEKTLQMVSDLSLKLHKPFVVHASRCELPIDTILKYMKRGDIFAHTYANKLPCIIASDGRIKEAVLDARARGVFFDVSHGNGNFSFEIVKKALKENFLPDAISTDLHLKSKPLVQNLSLTMSKMLACGLELWEVIQMVTVKPAKMLGLQEKAVVLKKGSLADLTLFHIEDGEWEMKDCDGETLIGKQQIVVDATILGKQMNWLSERKYDVK